MLKHNYSTTEVLTILQEECAEVIVQASKIKRFGHEPRLMRRLAEEIGDLQCMIDICQEYDLISFTDIEEYGQQKREKLKVFSDILG